MCLQTFPGIKVLPLFLSRESSLSCYRSDGPIKVGENFFIFVLTYCRMVDSMLYSESKPPLERHTMTPEQNNKRLFRIPFPGLYHSYLNDAIYQEIERMMEGPDCESLATGQDWDDFWTVYEGSTVALAAGKLYFEFFADALEEETGVKVNWEFESVTSPREYNFQTDSLYAYLSDDDTEKLLGKVAAEKLQTAATDIFTSRSGFMSFYPPNISEWPERSKWDHNHLYTVLLSWFDNDALNVIEADTCEDISGNGRVYNWLSADCMAVINRVTWKENLTTEEIEHLRENKVDTFERMRAVRKMQRSMAKMHGKEPCYDCRAIAVKLGIEEELIGVEA